MPASPSTRSRTRSTTSATTTSPARRASTPPRPRRRLRRTARRIRSPLELRPRDRRLRRNARHRRRFDPSRMGTPTVATQPARRPTATAGRAPLGEVRRGRQPDPSAKASPVQATQDPPDAVRRCGHDARSGRRGSGHLTSPPRLGPGHDTLRIVADSRSPSRAFCLGVRRSACNSASISHVARIEDATMRTTPQEGRRRSSG